CSCAGQCCSESPRQFCRGQPHWSVPQADSHFPSPAPFRVDVLVSYSLNIRVIFVIHFPRRISEHGGIMQAGCVDFLFSKSVPGFTSPSEISLFITQRLNSVAGPWYRRVILTSR